MLCLFLLVQLLFADGAHVRVPMEQRCCKYAGCFDNQPPLDHMEVPACPETLNITYLLYTRNNRDSPDFVSRTKIGPNFSGERRTIFIAHGWTDSIAKPWIPEIKDNLLNHGDYNIVLVDWKDGAKDPYYPQPAANTQSVGAENALVMRNLVSKGGASYGNMYCIGHSLGSHVCGHTGKRTDSKIGRITAFDPAGPLFEGFDKKGRVDKADALFVDVLHTASEGFDTLDLGMDEAIGHVDFYPNNGRCQTGCADCGKDAPFNLTDPSCSHQRPHAYFNEALKTGCAFTSYPCQTKDDGTNGKCNNCKGNCQSMTMDSEKRPGRGTYYLITNGAPPYCRG